MKLKDYDEKALTRYLPNEPFKVWQINSLQLPTSKDITMF